MGVIQNSGIPNDRSGFFVGFSHKKKVQQLWKKATFLDNSHISMPLKMMVGRQAFSFLGG